jgi:hypothetical protein
LASIFKQHFDYDERMLFYETGLSEEELAEDRERLPKWVPQKYRERMQIKSGLM